MTPRPRVVQRAHHLLSKRLCCYANAAFDVDPNGDDLTATGRAHRTRHHIERTLSSLRYRDLQRCGRRRRARRRKNRGLTVVATLPPGERPDEDEQQEQHRNCPAASHFQRRVPGLALAHPTQDGMRADSRR